VSVVGQEEIQMRQANVAEEVLREVPGAVPSIGQQVNNGNGGSAYVNLRGLGEQRNIVLLDGVRIVPAGLAGLTDLNNIPLALLDRVDVLTGGASTTYGADAISGVVNFITRKDFAGVDLSAGSKISQRGDGAQYRFDLTVGANFDGGRGNAVLSLGYQKVYPIYQGDRSFSQVAIESYLAECISCQGSSTTVPARFTLPVGAGARQIDPNTGALLGAPFIAFNFNPYNIFQTPFERYNIYGAGHYQITDSIDFYARGLFSNNYVQTIIAPSGVFGSAVTIPLSNPFLPAAMRTQICTNLGLTTAQCTAAAAATSPTDPNYVQFTTQLRRRTVEAGPRLGNFTTRVFDVRAGLRGAITDHINWDVWGAYGQSQKDSAVGNYVALSRVRQALLATNPNTCLTTTGGCVPLNVFGAAGTISPAMVNFIVQDSVVRTIVGRAQARGVISGDFGFTSPFAANPIGFAVGAEYRKDTAQQLPDTLAQTPGELGGAGGATPKTIGGLDVYEGFAEIIAPLVTDRPFMNNLTIEAGVRQSHYKIFAPGTPKFNATTWKVGGTWEFVKAFKVRGNYQRAVRAPNISELFAPVNTGLTSLAVDPCAGAAPNANANLKAICLAQGAPPATIGTIANPTAAQANETVGGNPQLKPEVSNSYTIGAVFQPRFIPNFALTIDYYHIRIKGAITSPTPGDIIAACFGATPSAPPANANLAACTSIRRNPITGALEGDPAVTPGLFAVLSNLGKLATDGVDLSFNWRTPLPFMDSLSGVTGSRLSFSFNGNWTRHSKFQATPTSLNRECVGFYSVNCPSPQPKYSFTERTTLTMGPVDLSLLWRYIHHMQFEPAQLQADIANCGLTADPGANDPNGCVIDPAFRRIGAKSYFDLTTRVKVSDRFEFTMAVQNLFDLQPPIVGQTIGSTSYNSGDTYPSSYDPIGRRFAFGARLKF
jgi:outer membrane receptor protein involved in Fe transport